MPPPGRELLLALLVGALAPSARAQLRILLPKALAGNFPEGTVYGTTATFGAPYYGERVLGRLLYGESKGAEHCSAEDYDLPPAKEVSGGKKMVNVALVRRGGCTFVSKVRVAEAKGAHAVVVVDRANSSATSEEIQHVMMADDGWGYQVKIPSLLISAADGKRLMAALKKGEVLVELAWDIPRGEVVVADFWMSSGSRESSEFLQRFKGCAEVLAHHLQFVPHYHVFSLMSSSANGHLCTDDSSNFCAPDPDGPGVISGADVANEDLRQLCIWNVTARMAPGGTKGATFSQEYWDYVVRFAEQCPISEGPPAQRFSEQCGRAVMRKLGIDRHLVAGCVKQHRQKFLGEQVKNTAWSPQALRVNGWHYSGPLDPEAVLKAVCGGFSRPLLECRELLASARKRRRSGSRALQFGLVAWICLGAGLLLVFCFYLYRSHVTSSVRKVLREEVMLEVQTQMADYAQLSDGLEKQGDRPSLSF